MEKSYSQLGQDIYILNLLNKKHNGYFIEIGVGDPEKFSNTYLLETEYGWTGILCEPNPNLYNIIKQKRTSPVETAPIWSNSGEFLDFGVCHDFQLSGFIEHFNEHRHRSFETTTKMKTISVNDMLKKYNAPTEIDYISLDTEGSEYDILQSFDFEKYNVKIWTVEHNTEVRTDGRSYFNKIIGLFASKGYLMQENGFDSYFYKLDK